MKKIILKIKKALLKVFNIVKEYIKKFFKNRINLIITITILVILCGYFLFSLISANRRKAFILNHIYDMYPEEVREIYSNMVDVSCNGDLYFNIDIGKELSTVELDKNNLLDYLFSNLDKNNQLTNKFKKTLITKTQKELFLGRFDLLDEINDYQYGDFIYNIKGNKIVRKTKKCESNNKYVSFLYGYSWNDDELSIDIHLGYLKDNKLYDLNNNDLGEYSDNMKDLLKMFESSPYYRLYYVKKNGLFKLQKVSLNSKA